jgi:hypothetical protein
VFRESHGIRGHSQGTVETFFVTPALNFTYFLTKREGFVKNNRGTSFIGDKFVSYDR